MSKECFRLERIGESPQDRLLVARGLFEGDHAPAALRELEAALHEYPEHSEALYLQGLILSREKPPDLQAAAASLAMATRLRPEHLESHYALAQVQRDQGAFDAALRTIQTAQKLAPDDPDVHCLRGDVLVDLGRTDDARRAFERALACEPQSARAHAALAGLELQADHTERAHELARDAVALAPVNADYRLLLADTLLKQNKLDAAMRVIREAARVAPGSAEPFTRIARSLRNAQRGTEAIGLLTAAVGREPKNAACYDLLAELYREEGRAAEADACAAKAAAIRAAAPTAPDPTRSDTTLAAKRGVDTAAASAERTRAESLRSFAQPIGKQSPLLRDDLLLVDLQSSGFLLVDEHGREQYALGDEERQLIRWLDDADSLQTIRARYEQRFGERISRRQVRAFVRQLDRFGLTAKPVYPVERAGGISPASSFADSPPASGGANFAFDLLTMLFGWLLHPDWLIPLGVLLAIAITGFVGHAGRFAEELTAIVREHPIRTLLLVFIERLFLIALPRELIVGMVCRRFGGRVRSFGWKMAFNILPSFHCDGGESVLDWTGRAKWTYLSIRFWVHLLVVSIAVLGWLMAPQGSPLAQFWLLLIVPCLIGLFLELNIFVEADGYGALVHAFKAPRLRERAIAETWAWLTFGRSPAPLSDDERFWFRAYGLGVFLWKIVVYTLVVGLGGYVLITRFGAAGAGVGLILLLAWQWDGIRDWVMNVSAIRWIVRGGGIWWLRWLIRIVVLAGIVWCGFLPYNFEAVGDCRVVPIAEAGVRSEIAGTIEKIHVHPGDRVAKGDVIATLTARDERIAVARSEAELARAQADLDLLNAGSRPQEIQAAAENVEMKQIQLRYLESELERIRDLTESNAAAERELTQAQDLRDSAERSLNIAQEQLKIAQEGARPEQVRAAEAEVQRIQAELAHYRELLTLADIQSPIDGQVVTLNIEQREGQYLARGDLVAVVRDTSHLKIELLMREVTAVDVKPEQNAKIRLWALDGALITGTVRKLAAEVTDYETLAIKPVRSDREAQLEEAIQDEGDRYVLVTVEPDPEAQERLIAGMTGAARIEIRTEMLWQAIVRPVWRFLKVEVWSWLP